MSERQAKTQLLKVLCFRLTIESGSLVLSWEGNVHSVMQRTGFHENVDTFSLEEKFLNLTVGTTVKVSSVLVLLENI